jgi:hypothetical protein
MFNEFIQSWVGYELVKGFGAYGLQPRSLHPKSKQWSPDLFEVFTYLENKSALNEKQQTSAKRIIEVLFNITKHNGHFAKVQFGSKRNIMVTQNFKLSLIERHHPQSAGTTKSQHRVGTRKRPPQKNQN